jgi:hypothetical protein
MDIGFKAGRNDPGDTYAVVGRPSNIVSKCTVTSYWQLAE